ncbi:MAG: hypothetical protein KJ626_02310 [Verrucomicrobia bacterium]|nr:hypothetical protein [Verrucomicrobiota bacterium]
MTPPNSTYSFSELCEELRKSSMYVMNIQRALELYTPTKEEGYSEPYLVFLQKIISLRTFSIPMDEIVDLFKKEKKILELLHIDSISDSPTWYLDACVQNEPTSRHLLLTGHDLGVPLNSGTVQSNLDFRDRQPELFSQAETGEDVTRILKLYLDLLDKITARVELEKPVLSNALIWASETLRNT